MSGVAEYSLSLLVLAGATWLPGYALERLAFRERDLRGLRSLARIVLGVGFWTASSFVLAAVGWLNATALAGIVLSTAACALTTWRIFGRSEHLCLPDPTSRAGFALVFALLLPFYLLALSPEISWDADVYHLTLPRLFIEHGGFRSVSMSIYSQWPLGTELLFALAMLAKDFVLAKLVHFAFGALTLFALVVGCRAFYRGGGGTLAALFFLANPVVLKELPIAYVDLAHAFFFTAAFLFALQAAAAQEEGASWSWLLSGVCCGVIAGLKITGIVSALAIAVLAVPSFLAAKRHGSLAPTAARFAVCFCSPLLAFWLPWLVKAWIYTGNPIHPLGYSLFGGVDWSADLAIQFTRWQASIGMGREVIDYVLLPLRVILQGGDDYAHFDEPIGMFWIALLPITIVFGQKIRLVRSALVVSGVYFVTWAFLSQQMRFLLPVLPLLSMAGGVTVVDLCGRLGGGRARWLRRGAALALALAIATLHRDPMIRGLRMALRSPEEIQVEAAAVVPAVFHFVERSLPRDAVLLFVNTNRGFFCPREYLADSFFEASQIADWLRPAESVAELRALLDERGITHVLFERRNWGARYPAALQALLRNSKQVSRIYESSDRRIALYELL